MTEIAIHIEGMSCMHCVGRVRKAVEALPGVQNLDVQIGLVRATIDESRVKPADIEKAITNTGYTVVSG